MAEQDPLVPIIAQILEARGEDNRISDDIKGEVEDAIWQIIKDSDVYNRCNLAVRKVIRNHPELNGAQQRELTNWSWLVIRDHMKAAV